MVRAARSALRTMLLGLLEKEILAQAAREEDEGQAGLSQAQLVVDSLVPGRIGQVVPYEDLVCLIPVSLLSDELLDELEGIAQDKGRCFN